MGDNDPYIDFDGDSNADSYETETLDDGTTTYSHLDEDGNVDAVAYDSDNDGLIDEMAVDSDGDGELDTLMSDTNSDGYMDEETGYEPDGADQADPEESVNQGYDTSGIGEPLVDFDTESGREPQ